MHALHELVIGLREFFERGGDVLWLILVLTILLWSLIVERFWFFTRRYPPQARATIAVWEARADKTSWRAERIRDSLISEQRLLLERHVNVIKTLVAVLPMVGLLGTIAGMIQIFDVLVLVGTGNPRPMAAGFSAATISTMAGMSAALSGLYFSVYLQRRARAEAQRLASNLVVPRTLLPAASEAAQNESDATEKPTTEAEPRDSEPRD